MVQQRLKQRTVNLQKNVTGTATETKERTERWASPTLSWSTGASAETEAGEGGWEAYDAALGKEQRSR